MVLTFANGGTPAGNDPYLGVTFTTGTALLTQIESTLQTAGWVTQSGTPGGGSILMRGVLNSDNCYIKFSISGTNSNVFDLQGSDDAIETTLSPSGDTGLRALIVPDGENKVFITADTYAGCIAIIPLTGNPQIFHFGFLERIDVTDNTCIMVGRVCSALDITDFEGIVNTTNDAISSGYGSAFVHTSLYDGTTWSRIHSQFDSSLGTSVRNDGGGFTPTNTTYDPNVVERSGGSFSQSTTITSNTSYKSFLGGANPFTGEHVLGSYYYLEGYDNVGEYGNAQGGASLPFYYRGTVAFAVTGMSSAEGLSQFNGSSGNVYLSVAASWQGMRIA